MLQIDCLVSFFTSSASSKSISPLPVRLAAALALVCVSCAAGAQVAHFAGVETTVASTGLLNPQQVAVDFAGNVFIADSGNNRVLEEVLTATGYQETILASTGLKNPTGVAVDKFDHVYITDSGNSRILHETPFNGTYIQTLIPITGLNNPSAIAVDINRNLYIADYGNARVIKEAIVGSNYTQSPVESGTASKCVAVDSNGSVYICAESPNEVLRFDPSGSAYNVASVVTGGLSLPIGVAVDAGGVVYVADGGNSLILRELPTGNISYRQATLLSNSAARAIAVDSNRNVYLGDPAGATVLKLAQAGFDFGSLSVGASSTAASLLFSFDGGGLIGSPSVVTQGLSGMDYADAGTGTCTANGSQHTYSTGDTCTVDVLFTPKGPGGRYGAAVLRDSSGNTIATGYVQGNGLSPQVHFTPGILSRLSLPGVSSPTRITADAAGNLYIANAVASFDPGNAVYKETWTGTGYVRSTVADSSTLVYPLNVAVDGAGNVYILDAGTYAVYKYSPLPGGGYARSTFDTQSSNSNALAVDGKGNVYFASGSVVNTTELQIDRPADGYYGHVLLNVQAYPNSIAVDYPGNIYLSTDATGKNFLRETPSNVGYTQSVVFGSLYGPVLTADGLGNVYFGGIPMYEETPSGASYLQTVLTNPSSSPLGIAVDDSGSVYYSDPVLKIIYKLDFSHPAALHFAATPVGSTSSDSPRTAAFQNVGNAPLTFPIPDSGTNPSLPPGFTLRDTLATDCPSVLSGASSPGTLAAGASCNLAVSYSPQSASDTSGWMTITDDALNAPSPSYATQSIALAVAGKPLTPSLTWTNPASITYGVPLGQSQLNAVASVPGSFAYSPVSGTVLGVGPHTLTVTFTPSDTTAFTTSSTTVTIVVTQATPVITWNTPLPIVYGTKLSSTQLTASTPVAGTFTYSPGPGAVLATGPQLLTVNFVPVDITDYKPVSASATIQVNPATPTLLVSPISIRYGTASTTLGAYVEFSGATAPTGAVTLQVDSGPALMATCKGISPLFCTVSYATSALSGGSHTITASVGADTNYTSVSKTGALTVTKATPILAVSPISTRFGTSTTLAAYVEFAGPAAPTGAVTLQVDSGAVLAATCKGTSPLFCTVSYPTTTLSAGTHTITATVAPDTNYNTASKTGTLTVTTIAPILVVSPISTPYGTASTTLAAYVEFNAAIAPTGVVTLQVDSGSSLTASCKGTSPLFCTVSYATGTLSLGAHTITATVAADANYNSASKTGTLTVTQGTPKVVVIPASIPSSLTQSATLRALVEFTGAIAPTGTVTFQVDAGQANARPVMTATCTPALSCTVSYFTAGLTAGRHTITVTITADANYNAASGTGTLLVD